MKHATEILNTRNVITQVAITQVVLKKQKKFVKNNINR